MPIAIIGIGCRFPGGVVDADSFWRLLADGTDAITEIPGDRFAIDSYYDAKPASPGKVMSRWGGFIQQRFDEFDAEFFGISRTYAERLDPQQRLLLETSWEALEDAGADVAALQGSSTGVFIGQWLSDFEHRLFADHAGIDFASTLGSGRYAVPGRVSYALGFRGPSLSVDAGCAAGLAAVHLAVRSLRSGECTLALAGGVNVILQPHIHVAYSQSRMMAPDGHCKFGDARGDGYVRAEGVGVVVLKPLDRARADGDRVYAVIRGSAVNSDGDSSGSMGTPSRVGQEELIRAALRDARVAPADVAYVEAHGTGTRAGDPVELGVLSAVLSEGRSPGTPAWVGSVKTNVGHTEATAGVAGLIKGALMVQRGMIPPSLHFAEPNPDVAWDTSPVAVPTALLPWPVASGPRLVGVSSFGIGGTNAHVVLASLEPEAGEPVPVPRDAALVLPLSTRSQGALQALAARYADLLEAPRAPAAAIVCAAAATRRSALTHRAAFVQPDQASLVSALRDFAAGAPASADGIVHDRAPRRVAFVVPGQGAQWTGMAREMLAHEPAFRDALVQCDAAVRGHATWSILEQLQLAEDAPGYLGDRIEVIQPTLVALAIAYAAWLRSVGIEPDAVVGHSLGEVGAAAIAGVIDVPTAMRIIVKRSALMQQESGRGAMAVVELSHAEAARRLNGYEADVSVAVSNSPRSSVISGAPVAIDKILAGLQQEGVFCRLVKVDVASHSPQMAPLAAALVPMLTDVTPRRASTPIYSTVDAARRDGANFDGPYWGRNLTHPVRFGETVAQMLADGIGAFVELGPHPVLVQAIEQVAESVGHEVAAVACGRRESSDRLTALGVAATLWAHGATVAWRRVMPWHGGAVELPRYPWQRERFWTEAANLQPADATGRRRPALTAKVQQSIFTLAWEEAPPPRAGDTPPGRWVIVASPEVDAQEVATALRARGDHALVVTSVREAGDVVRRENGAGAWKGIVVLPAADDVIAYSPVAGLNALRETAGAASATIPRVWWVTVGAQAVAGEAAPQSPRRAAMWGAARVLAEEHPESWGGLIDLAPSSAQPLRGAQIAAQVMGSDGEDQVAFRGETRYALRFVPADRAPAVPFAWRPDAAYLITGGFGGVSLAMAREMVRDGARRLVLVGRSALPPRPTWAKLDADSPMGARVAAVRELERAGASVHVLQADVANEEAMRAAIDEYNAEGWPPIDGVVHNAAVLINRLSHELSRADFEAVLAPKLTGAVILDRLFPSLSLFVVASSMSVYWGPSGMANYAAANAGMDAVVAARRQRGERAISIQWGPWKETGMVNATNMQRNFAELENAGVHSIGTEEGVTFFRALLSRSESALSVLPVDWSVFRTARRGRDLPLFRAIPDAAPAPEDPSRDGEVLQRIMTAAALDRRSLLEGLVRGVVGAVLRRAPAALDARQPFGSMGVDSLLALEIRNRLETALRRPLTATLAWNYPTVLSLVTYLDGLLVPAVHQTGTAPPAAHSAMSASSAVPAELDEILSLSEEDAMLTLRRRGRAR
jgi:acyl transferase domain-containing protein